MAEDELLQKADALMHKHRVFVAGASAKPEAESDSDDVPVLTDIVSPDDIPHDAAPMHTPVDLAELRKALAAEVEVWLDEELPQHVLQVLDGITDQLVVQLSIKARSELLPKLQNLLEAPHGAATPSSAGD